MKILKPLLIDPENITSNAAVDPYPEWALVGRDFSGDWEAPAVTAGGNDLYVIRTPADTISDSNLRYHSLDTEARVDAPIANLGIRVEFAELSPSGTWLAIVGRDSGGATLLKVFATATGALAYSTTIDPALNRVGRRPIDWAPDSSKLALFRYPGGNPFEFAVKIVIVSTTTWSEVESSAFSLIWTLSGIWQLFVPALCFSKDGTHVYSIHHNYGANGASLPGSWEHRYWLLKVDATTAARSYVTLDLPDQAYSQFWVEHNPYRDEVLVQGYNASGGIALRVFDEATLAEKVTVPLSGPSIDCIRMAPGADELLVTTTSVQPYHRRFTASTYAAGTDLDAVIGGRSPDISYSTDYYVCAIEAGGFAMIARADDTPVAKVAPSVLDGDVYIYDDRVYEALADTQSTPKEGAAEVPPVWLDRGMVNPLRMFDGAISSVTTVPGNLVVQAKVGAVVKAVGLFNVQATTVQIQMLDQNGAEVFDTGELDMVDGSAIQDLSAYFFDGVTLSPDFVYTALPPYLNATVIVTVSPLSGVAAVGELVIGDILDIGDTEYGTGVGIIDFSKKERDVFGNFQIIERDFSKRGNFAVSIPTRLVSSVQQKLAEYRTTPIVFIGAEERPETVVYGFYRSFDIVLDGPKYSSCNIEVEGLT